jgi:sec-independent protein translocase protein TatA
MFGLGYQELMIILVIVLLLFGAQKLPELARGLGKSVSEFKKGQNELDEAVKGEKSSEETKKSA